MSIEASGAETGKKYDDLSHREAVGLFTSARGDVFEIIEASRLGEQAKMRIKEYFDEYLRRLTDDTLAERTLVMFNSANEIVRARSEEGVYSPFVTAQIFISELSDEFGSPLAMAFSQVDKKEMAELITAIAEQIQFHLDTQHLT